MSESPSSRKAVSARSARHPFEVAARTPHTIDFGPTAIHGDGLHVAMSHNGVRPFSPAFRSTLHALCLFPPDLARPQHRRHHAHQVVRGRQDRDLPGSLEPAGQRAKPEHRLPAGGVAHDAVTVCPYPGRAPHSMVRRLDDEPPHDRRPLARDVAVTRRPRALVEARHEPEVRTHLAHAREAHDLVACYLSGHGSGILLFRAEYAPVGRQVKRSRGQDHSVVP